MQKKTSLLKLFLYFFKVGIITFGGGYAILATIERELVEEKKWISHDEMINMLAIGEATPGPISINLATFIGYKMYKFWGAFFCTLGFTLPSLIIISIISLFIDYVMAIPVLAWMFQGIRAGVVVMIGNAWLKFFKRMDKHWFSFLIFFMAFFVSFFTDLNVIYVILIGGVLGLAYSLTVSKMKKDNEEKIKKIELAFEQDKILYNITRESTESGTYTSNEKINGNGITEANENDAKGEKDNKISNKTEKVGFLKRIQRKHKSKKTNDLNGDKEDKL